MDFGAFSSAVEFTSIRQTLQPLVAASWAMPVPIVPAPTTTMAFTAMVDPQKVFRMQLQTGHSLPALTSAGQPAKRQACRQEASHSEWHAQAVGAGMFAKSAFSMAVLRLAMAPRAGIAAFIGMHRKAIRGADIRGDRGKTVTCSTACSATARPTCAGRASS